MSYPQSQIRQLVADEAARLIYEEGYRDYRVAKHKASERLGASQQGQQPGNEEIEAALQAYVTLIDPEEHQTRVREHREIALEALGFLQDFQPYLTGAALEGTSGPHSAITLHLRANRAEDVMFFLEDQRIPFQIHERKLRAGKKQDYYPLLRFYVDNIEVELMIFPDEGRDLHTTTNPHTGKALRRADYRKLQELLSAEDKTN